MRQTTRADRVLICALCGVGIHIAEQIATLCTFFAVFPVFLRTPANVTVGIGKTAKLECSADGFPIPKISWHKDGGSHFPAAQDRRMKIMNLMNPFERQAEPFFIVNVRLEDEGIYTCQAENEAGSILSNASLRVLGE